MIPIEQQDAYKYYLMFKGSYYKGASVFMNMLYNKNQRDAIVASFPAMSAVFADIDKSVNDAICAKRLVAYSPTLYDTGLMTFLKGSGMVAEDNLIGFMNNTTEVINAEKTEPFATSVELSPTYVSKAFTKRTTIDTAMTTELSTFSKKPLAMSAILTTRAVTQTTTTKKLSTAITAWQTSNGTYNVNATYNGQYVKKFNCILVGVSLQLKTATTQYYAAILRYDCTAEAVTLVVVDTTYGTSSYNNNACFKPAYDVSDDTVYMFYSNNDNIYYACGTLTTSGYTSLKMRTIVGTYRSYTSCNGFLEVNAANGKASVAWADGVATMYVPWVKHSVVTKATVVTQGADLIQWAGHDFADWRTLNGYHTGYFVTYTASGSTSKTYYTFAQNIDGTLAARSITSYTANGSSNINGSVFTVGNCKAIYGEAYDSSVNVWRRFKALYIGTKLIESDNNNTQLLTYSIAWDSYYNIYYVKDQTGCLRLFSNDGTLISTLQNVALPTAGVLNGQTSGMQISGQEGNEVVTASPNNFFINLTAGLVDTIV